MKSAAAGQVEDGGEVDDLAVRIPPAVLAAVAAVEVHLHVGQPQADADGVGRAASGTDDGALHETPGPGRAHRTFLLLRSPVVSAFGAPKLSGRRAVPP